MSSPLPELDVFEKRTTTSLVSSTGSRKDRLFVLRDSAKLTQPDTDLTTPNPSAPKEGNVSSEPDDSFSATMPTPSREFKHPAPIVKSGTEDNQDQTHANPTSPETRAVGDPAGKVSLPEVEKVFAKFSLPGRGEEYETRAASPTGYKGGWRRSRVSIGTIEKYLAIAALLVFIPALLFYLVRPFDDGPPNQEVIAQESGDAKSESGLQTTAAEANPNTKPNSSIQWHSAILGRSADGSQNPGARNSNFENSPANGTAPNPAILATEVPTEAYQPNNEKVVPNRNRGKAEKKRVTVDDLITDKKKVTVDDLINDN